MTAPIDYRSSVMHEIAYAQPRCLQLRLGVRVPVASYMKSPPRDTKLNATYTNIDRMRPSSRGGRTHRDQASQCL